MNLELVKTAVDFEEELLFDDESEVEETEQVLIDG